MSSYYFGQQFLIVFVHGWSVRNINTYGALPYRLQEEAENQGIKIRTANIFLGEYISFHDEVRVPDIARAFQKAITDKIGDQIERGHRFICITHSTGGPVIREWWKHYYSDNKTTCPMSHLIMLAPANFGSGLAKLGKKALSRLLYEIHGVEPGTGVLEWLELGSRESWELNKHWIEIVDSQNNDINAAAGFFPFVITGDYIDRKRYDHAIPFTAEDGSDGVVRAAAANLNARYVAIKQTARVDNGNRIVDGFNISTTNAQRTAFLVVLKKAHSGNEMGIMTSVRSGPDAPPDETVTAILDCVSVSSKAQYLALCDVFDAATLKNQEAEKIEPPAPRRFISLRTKPYVHDSHAMIIFRVTDTEGYPVPFYEAILTGGIEGSPDYFPEDFMGKKQKNDANPGILTYYLNYDLLNGTPQIEYNGKIIREKTDSIEALGLVIYPYPQHGFVRYMPLRVNPSPEFLQLLVKKNSTVLVDITLQRLVSKETMELDDLNPNHIYKDFSDKKPSEDNVA